MKIVNESEIPKGHAGKKTLNSAEEWLFSKEGKAKMVRLEMLKNMQAGKVAIAELEEFVALGSKAKKTPGLDSSMNKVFILGNIPLIAKANNDKIMIRKLEKFDLQLYSRAVMKEMAPAHLETVKAKLDELMPKSTTIRMPDD